MLENYAKQLISFTNWLGGLNYPDDLAASRKLIDTILLLANKYQNRISLEAVNTISNGVSAIRNLNIICNEKHPKIPESLLEHLEKESKSALLAIQLKALFSGLLLNRVIETLNAQTRNLQQWNLEMEFKGIKIKVKDFSKEQRIEVEVKYNQNVLNDSIPHRAFQYEDGEYLFREFMRKTIENITENFTTGELHNAVKELSIGQENRIRKPL